MSFNSCKESPCFEEINYDWKVCHIIHNDNEVLNNNIKKNHYNIPLIDSGIFRLRRNDILYKSFKKNISRNNSEIIEYSIFQKGNKCYLQLKHPSNDEFNGDFEIILDGVEEFYEGSQHSKETRMLLKSKKTSIYLTRYLNQV